MSQMDAAYIRMANQLAGALEGLPLGQPMQFSGGGSDLHGCGVCPTHCFRTVSQRSLNTPTTFISDSDGVLIAGDDVFSNKIWTGALSALRNVIPGDQTSQIIFNDANLQSERQRIFGLVLIGVRARTILNIEPVDAAAAAVPSRLADSIAETAMEFMALSVYHTSDRNDPWIDRTTLKYFERENDEFLPVPPVKWVDRDPAMGLSVNLADYGGGVDGVTPTLGVHHLVGTSYHAQAIVVIETLFIPDPDTCGRFWPGQLCDKSDIGNTPAYKGASIPTAVKPAVY